MAKQINQLNDLTFIPEEILFPVDAKNPLTDEYETVKIDKNYLQQNLNEVLSIGNTTNGNNIVMSDGDAITSENGGSLNFNQVIANVGGVVETDSGANPGGAVIVDWMNFANVGGYIDTDGNGTGLEVNLWGIPPSSYGIDAIINPGSGYEVGDTLEIYGPGDTLLFTTEILQVNNGIPVEVLTTNRTLVLDKITSEDLDTSISFVNDLGGGVISTDSGSLPPFGDFVSYVISPVSTSGGGTGLVVNMVRNAADNTFGIAPVIPVAGSGYEVGDTISFLGTQYGLSSPADDATYKILSVTDEVNNIVISSTDGSFTTTQTLNASSYNITNRDGNNNSSISGDSVSLNAVVSDGVISSGLNLNPFDNIKNKNTRFYIEDTDTGKFSQVSVKRETSFIQIADSNFALYNAIVETSVTEDLIIFRSLAYNYGGNGYAVLDGVVDLVTDESVITLYADVIKLNTNTLNLPNLPTYADNAAALAGGLTVDCVYKTATGELRIVVRNK